MSLGKWLIIHRLSEVFYAFLIADMEDESMKFASRIVLAVLSAHISGCANTSLSTIKTQTEHPVPAPAQAQSKAILTENREAKEAATLEPPSPSTPQDLEPAQSYQDQLSLDQLTVRPGECWVQAVVNPRPIQKPVNIVVRDAVNDIKVTPALLEATKKEIIIREAGITYRVKPPKYKRIQEKVMVRPEIRRTVVVPAVFEERSVDIEIEAEHTVLERCKVSSAHHAPGIPMQTLCTRHIPAKKKSIKRKILVQPETTREEIEPAVYKEVSRWIVETPARIIPVDIHPRTRSIRVQEIARPERIEEEQIPPKIKQLAATLFEGEPKLVFRRVVCDHDLTTVLIKQVQLALENSGFNPGPIDGKFGKRTYQAMVDYQRQKGLAYGALTYETLEHLGVKAE